MKYFGKSVSHIFTLVLCVVLLAPLVLAIISVDVSSAPTEEEIITGGYVPASYFERENSNLADVVWSPKGSSIADTDNDNTTVILSYSEKAEGSVTFDPPKNLWGSYVAGILLTPIYGNVTVTLTADFGDTERSVSVHLDRVGEYFIYILLPEDENELHSMSFAADFSALDKKNPVSSVTVSVPIFSGADKNITITGYSAFSFRRDNTITAQGNAAYVGEGITSLSSSKEYIYAAEVTVTGGSGSLSFFLSSDGKKTVSCGSSVLRGGRDSYMFLLPEDARLSPVSFYRIEFTGDGASGATVTAVRFHKIPVPATLSDTGEVTECSVIDGRLTLSGALTRDTVVNYIDGTIRLIEIMPWEMDDPDILTTKEPSEEIPMSSSFTFSKKLSAESAHMAAFGVVIYDGETVVPLSDIIYPDVKTNRTLERSSSSAVVGVSPENALFAGYDQFLIPVDVDTLFEESDALTFTLSVRGRRYSPEGTKVKMLGHTVDFLRAAGIDPVFYITGRCISDVANEEHVMQLYAAITYLSDTFSPRGIILGSPDSDEIRAKDAASLLNRVRNTALIMRMLCLATDDSTFVAMEETVRDDSDTFLWYLSMYTDVVIDADFEYVLRTSSPDNSQFAVASATDGGYDRHISLLLECVGADAPIFTERLSRLANTTYIISITDGDCQNILTNSDKPVTEISDIPEDLSSLPLFDFSDSYDVETITPSLFSDGVFIRKSELLEEISPGNTGVLRTVLTKKAPVLILSAKSPLDIRSMSTAKITFAARVDSPVILDIMFISGSSRVVHSVNVDSAAAHNIFLDLAGTGVASSLERIVFVIRDGDALTLDLANVTLYGTGDVSSPEDLFVTETASPAPNSPIPQRPSSPSSQKNETDLAPFMVVAAAFIVSAIIFVLLSVGGNVKKKPPEKK